MIQLIQSRDGRLVIANNSAFQGMIERVEYFRDLRLLMLSYGDNEDENELMTCEIESHVAPLIQNTSDIIILELKKEAQKQKGYLAPLVQIGL